MDLVKYSQVLTIFFKLRYQNNCIRTMKFLRDFQMQSTLIYCMYSQFQYRPENLVFLGFGLRTKFIMTDYMNSADLIHRKALGKGRIKKKRISDWFGVNYVIWCNDICLQNVKKQTRASSGASAFDRRWFRKQTLAEASHSVGSKIISWFNEFKSK